MNVTFKLKYAEFARLLDIMQIGCECEREREKAYCIFIYFS